MAMNAARNLSNSYSQLSTSVQRLSSGLRINSAADDAAGLAVRELMRSDITVLNQGVRNANDAISMIQTADGALSVIDEKLIRMKELAEQAATGTYTTAQRLIMDSEYQAMASEITRIATATDFNGVKLLDGSLSGLQTGHTQAGMKIHFGTGNASAEDYYYIKINSATSSALGIGGGSTRNLTNSEIAAANGITYLGVMGNFFPGIDSYDNMPDPPRSDLPTGTFDQFDDNAGGFYNVIPDFSGKLRAFHYDWSGNYLGEANLILTATGSGGSSISTQDAAQQALETIDRAIISKDTIRANLGAMQNRLSNTITNLTIQAENLQAAESRISDVDVATEMTEFVRQQILSQAAVSMLSQANSLPQMALQLLGG
jgi:flagellin